MLYYCHRRRFFKTKMFQIFEKERQAAIKESLNKGRRNKRVRGEDIES